MIDNHFHIDREAEFRAAEGSNLAKASDVASSLQPALTAYDIAILPDIADDEVMGPEYAALIVTTTVAISPQETWAALLGAVNAVSHGPLLGRAAAFDDDGVAAVVVWARQVH